MKVERERGAVVVSEAMPDMEGGIKASRSWTFNDPAQAERQAGQFALQAESLRAKIAEAVALKSADGEIQKAAP